MLNQETGTSVTHAMGWVKRQGGIKAESTCPSALIRRTDVRAPIRPTAKVLRWPVTSEALGAGNCPPIGRV